MMEYHRMNKISGAPADVELVCSQLSCQDPQVVTERRHDSRRQSPIFQANLAGCIKAGDLTTFSALLAEVAPLDDQGHLSLPDDEKQVGCEV